MMLSRPASLAVMAALLASPALAQDRPKLLPDHDVDITYRVMGTGKPISQRVRWLAADHMERIDGPGDTAVLADRTTSFITIVSPRSKSYVKLQEPAGGVFKTDQAGPFSRIGGATVAQLACTEWGWTDASTQKLRTVCATDDGVMLRMAEEGRTLVEATAVTYRKVQPKTFQLPKGYEPTPAPEGVTE